MFNLLSSQAKLLILLSNYSTQELEVVSVNFKLTIKLLNQSVTQLLENRRIHGALLPREDKSTDDFNYKDIQSLSCEQVLLKKDYLIKAINEFCLTEAIIVRDNFSNCLEFIADQSSAILPITDIKLNKREKKSIIERSKVSPIHLTEIKQRLAQALHKPCDKKESVKAKLNKLLTSTNAAQLNA
ncbi:hypothetical protein [Colwellia sp. Bg11-28]|uniref:hypothetical protein n=1 Tax=Colwellia sp. Bg11-28 TaxID=2058305 RepID=UPI000C32F0DE|nr:hypothetical protein [Colwellia sp. Bg11-28]PKH89487.1 hypothetical protein CXF79_01540 [Colwellia sp. Bg11-28]